ncbi:unnamed protein product [Adineta steineri]|uniref:BTB domain-containing protein n=2 Tax=Adineta steineri TaxID=433720 RepID=A0A818SLB7_9BILA|nr:unnamed protein product [Adineta steineri]CAF1181254.1 unnamed protein product [Adineta steineri]CAF3671208.1 unnamed protein product [Adineta steineri]CAF3742297.1 unnamed protein product [Adineta steineri]
MSVGITTPSTVDSNNNNQYIYTKSDYASDAISKFALYLRDGFLCDITFICELGQIKRRFVAHRLVVSTLSDYFRVMFENHVQNEIILNNTDADIFEKFILYAYEGHLEINSNDVVKILETSHSFHITEIVDLCCKFIKKQLQSSNCLSLYRFASLHNLLDLMQHIWTYILEHFSEIISNNQEFLNLSYDELKQFLASDDINVESEEIVYEAFLRWLDYDFNRRNEYLAELFSLIRLPLIKRKYLTDLIDGNERFENNSVCQMFIIEAMRYHLAPEKRSTMKSIRTQPRKSTLGSLYCLGGYDSIKNSQTIEKFDFRTHTWQIDSQWNSRRCQFACVRLNNKLYVCGGRDGLKALNSTEIYNFQTKTWTMGAPMITNRYDLDVTCIGGPIYAVGGHDGRAILDTVERFNPDTSEWTYVASMNSARYTLGVGVLENRIYAIGGEDSATSLRDTESFDPHTNRWIQCASMHKRRGSVAVVACNGFIYAVGGHEISTINKSLIRHDDGERYDPKSNQWTLITSFSRPKEALGIAVVNTKLYIVGGFDGKGLNEMERYDTETDKWRKSSPLKTKRVDACLIHVPSSIHQTMTWPVLSQGNKENVINIASQVNRIILS